MLKITKQQYDELVEGSKNLPQDIKDRLNDVSNELCDISASHTHPVTELLFLGVCAAVDPEYPVWDEELDSPEQHRKDAERWAQSLEHPEEVGDLREVWHGRECDCEDLHPPHGTLDAQGYPYGYNPIFANSQVPAGQFADHAGVEFARPTRA